MTFDLYEQKDWKQLTKIGEKALKSDVDYFYLRMRLGIASYERKNYTKALRHFRKALEFNSSDNYALEYIYFSNLYLGREITANHLARNFPEKLKEKINFDYSPGIRSFSTDVSFDFAENSGVFDNYSITIDPMIDGKQIISRGFQYYQAGIEFDAGKRSRMSHSASYLSRKGLLYAQDAGETLLESENRISQFQYFVAMNIDLGGGFYMIPSVQYINIRSPYLTTAQNRWGLQYSLLQYAYEHQFVGFLGLGKTFGKFKPELSSAFLYLNEAEYFQSGVSLTYYPFGNLNLYTISRGYYHFPINGGTDEGKMIFFQDVGLKVLNNLWFEIWLSHGTIENFAGNSGFLIYNDVSKITQQYGANLIVPFFKSGMELSFRYRYSMQESHFISDENIQGITENKYLVNHNTLTGGIKWKF